MEACGGAHHWARLLQAQGLPGEADRAAVREAVREDEQDDANDAEAICEAMSRPSMRFVAVKTRRAAGSAGGASGALEPDPGNARRRRIRLRGPGLRVRSGSASRTERPAPGGTALAGGCRQWLDARFRRCWPACTAICSGSMTRSRTRSGDRRDRREHEPVGRRLQQLRGIGPLTATRAVALVGDGDQFRNGRELAVALGLTPRQHSSGGKERLLGISKRGDKYVARC